MSDPILVRLNCDDITELSDAVRISLERLGLFVTQQGEALTQAVDDLTAEVQTLRRLLEAQAFPANPPSP